MGAEALGDGDGVDALSLEVAEAAGAEGALELASFSLHPDPPTSVSAAARNDDFRTGTAGRLPRAVAGRDRDSGALFGPAEADALCELLGVARVSALAVPRFAAAVRHAVADGRVADRSIGTAVARLAFRDGDARDITVRVAARAFGLGAGRT
jgi:hypothetical protein